MATTGEYRRTVHRYELPDVRLVDQDGERVSLSQELDGPGPVMLNFIFTTCPTICPVLSATFAQAQDELGPELEQIRMISITIDPEQDTPDALKAYARRFKAGPQWRFLTGSLADIVRVQRAFDAYRGNKMSHQPLAFLRADPDAEWIRIEGFARAEDLVREYRALAGG